MLGDEAIDGGLQFGIDMEAPRFKRRLVSFVKKPSTALSHEQVLSASVSVSILKSIFWMPALSEPRSSCGRLP
jgi:hypothetical protein